MREMKILSKIVEINRSRLVGKENVNAFLQNYKKGTQEIINKFDKLSE